MQLLRHKVSPVAGGNISMEKPKLFSFEMMMGAEMMGHTCTHYICRLHDESTAFLPISRTNLFAVRHGTSYWCIYIYIRFTRRRLFRYTLYTNIIIRCLIVYLGQKNKLARTGRVTVFLRLVNFYLSFLFSSTVDTPHAVKMHSRLNNIISPALLCLAIR